MILFLFIHQLCETRIDLLMDKTTLWTTNFVRDTMQHQFIIRPKFEKSHFITKVKFYNFMYKLFWFSTLSILVEITFGSLLVCVVVFVTLQVLSFNLTGECNLTWKGGNIKTRAWRGKTEVQFTIHELIMKGLTRIGLPVTLFSSVPFLSSDVLKIFDWMVCGLKFSP
jgi:hypothetical protein